MSRLTCVVIIALASTYGGYSQTVTRPDWIPVGAVSPEVEHRALVTHARISSDLAAHQHAALRDIGLDIQRHGTQTMRLAATPIVAGLLLRHYEILDPSGSAHVQIDVRTHALDVLIELGGVEARRMVRDAIAADPDPTVRAYAASLLAAKPSSRPQQEYHAVADALRAATRRGSDSAEVARLLRSAHAMYRRAWNPTYPPLIDALMRIYEGPYSSSTKDRAMSFLEALAER